MYKIDSKVDKPNTSYLVSEVKKMMARGIKVGNVEKLYDLYRSEQNKYIRDIQMNYGIVNPNSSAQVISYLQDQNEPEIVEACASQGKWSSNKAALIAIASLGYKVGEDLINYRTAKKFADSLQSIMGFTGTDGKIHPEVTITKTNRISYRNPAIMNIPKELLWDVVIPSRDGDVLISADIKNQEPNILINMNNIKSLKPALTSDKGLYEEIYSRIPVHADVNIIFSNDLKPGVLSNDWMMDKGLQPVLYTPKPMGFPGATVDSSDDKNEISLIHILNIVVPIGQNPELDAVTVVELMDGVECRVPITIEADLSKPSNRKKKNEGGIIQTYGTISGITLKCENKVRSEFKRAWNAMTYGASRPGVKQMCNIIDGEKLYDFFSTIPELKVYRDRCQKLAYGGHQNIDTYFGTTLHADEYNSGALKRVLLDLPIQGTAADILSLLVRHFNEEVKNRGFEGLLSVYYTRHDELIIEAAKELVNKLGLDKIKLEIADIVEHQVDDWVPFKVEIKEVEKNNRLSDIIESAMEDTD